MLRLGVSIDATQVVKGSTLVIIVDGKSAPTRARGILIHYWQ